jgi:WD40 repeat protein
MQGSFVVSPNGRMVVKAGQDGVVRFWNGLTGQPAGQQIIYACPDSLLSARFNGSGGLLALACDGASDTQAKLQIFFYSPNYYRPDAMSLFKVFRSNSASSGLVAFTADSALLAVTSGNTQVGSRANQLELWGFYTQRREVTLSLVLQDVLQIEFSRDGKLMALSLSDGSLEIWGVPSAQS